MKVVYVASPYTNGDRIQNVLFHMGAVAELVKMGYAPIAPLLFHYVDERHRMSYDRWLNVCLSLITKADCVLRLNGYSPGADAEVVMAMSLGIPVVYSFPQAVDDFFKENP